MKHSELQLKEAKRYLNLFKNLAKNRATHAADQRKLAKLLVKIAKNEKDIEDVQCVSFFFNGMPVCARGDAPHWGASCPVTKRSAKTYLNAHNKTTFGMHVYEPRGHGMYDDEYWCGADWENYDNMKKAAIEWVTGGVRPARDGKR